MTTRGLDNKIKKHERLLAEIRRKILIQEWYQLGLEMAKLILDEKFNELESGDF